MIAAKREMVDPVSNGTKMPYLPGLDGLRAMAVVMVILYHLELDWFPGGFLGVEAFFVISGYLITALMIGERARSGRVDMVSFWLRRARRLLPALAVLLLSVSVFVALFVPEQLVRVREEVVAACGYVTNWYLVVRDVSYFESFARPSPLLHLWSLAIEEQFYLVWPLAFWGGMRALGQRSFSVAVLVGAVASLVLMALLFEPYTDPSRVYYGTDTRASGLLIGVLGALYWRPWEDQKKGRPLGMEVLGVVGMLALTGIGLGISEFKPFLYQGGFLLVDLSTLAVVVVMADNRTRIAGLLGIAPIRWVGQRSYGLYLWHWPIFLYTGSHGVLGGTESWGLLPKLLVLCVVTEVSYRLFEVPIRRYGAWRAVSELVKTRDRAACWRAAPSLVLALLVTGATVVLVTTPAAAPKAEAQDSAPVLAEPVPVEEPLDAPPAPTESAESTGSTELADRVAAVKRDAAEPPVVHEVMVLGDSVMMGIQRRLADHDQLEAQVDLAESRSFSAGLSVLRALRRDRTLEAPVVVIHLGNNGVMREGQFDNFMRTLRKQRLVLFINLRVRHRHESIVNEQLREGVSRHPTAELLDWHSISENKPEYFRKDRTHLSHEGKVVFLEALLSRLDELHYQWLAETQPPAPAGGAPLMEKQDQ